MDNTESVLTTTESTTSTTVDKGIDYHKLGTIDFDDLWQQTILSQYSNSTVIKTLVQRMSELLDPKPDMKVFFDAIFDVSNKETCSQIGGKIWSNIVAMSNANGVDVQQGKFFGYDTTERHTQGLISSFYPYNQAPFVFDEPGSGRFEFSSEDLNALVLAKALANITCATLPNLKRFMKTILGSGNFAVDNLHNAVGGGQYAYVRVEPEEGDNPKAENWYEEKSNGSYKKTEDTEVKINPSTGYQKHYFKQVAAVMAVKFVISGSKPVTLELFKLHAPLVIGAGVKIYYQSTGANFFGFDGSDLGTNFDNGVFFDEDTGGWAFGEL